MKHNYLALICLGFISSASANNNIEFINNTDAAISMVGNIAVDGILDCKGSCVKPIYDIEILPYSSKIINLETQVNNNKLNWGAFGFTISTPDKNGTYQVVVPVVATPSTVFVQSLKAAGSVYAKSFSTAEGVLPKYSISIAQNIKRESPLAFNLEANETVISINALRNIK